MSDSPFTPEQEARIKALIRAESTLSTDHLVTALRAAQADIESALATIRRSLGTIGGETEPPAEPIQGNS